MLPLLPPAGAATAAALAADGRWHDCCHCCCCCCRSALARLHWGQKGAIGVCAAAGRASVCVLLPTTSRCCCHYCCFPAAAPLLPPTHHSCRSSTARVSGGAAQSQRRRCVDDGRASRASVWVWVCAPTASRRCYLHTRRCSTTAALAQLCHNCQRPLTQLHVMGVGRSVCHVVLCYQCPPRRRRTGTRGMYALLPRNATGTVRVSSTTKYVAPH